MIGQVVCFFVINQTSQTNHNYITSEQFHFVLLSSKILQKRGVDVMDTNEKIRYLLEQNGWSEYRLARNSGLADSTVINIFKRNTVPSIPTLEAICKALDCQPGDLLEYREEDEIDGE